MSQLFYLGDLTAAASVEATVDGITNLAVDGAGDFLLGAAQLPFLAEMSGLAGQDKVVWYRLGAGEALPEFAFQGFVLEAADARRLMEEDRGRLDGMRLAVRWSADGDDLAALACDLREAGVAEVLAGVDAGSGPELLQLAADARHVTALPLLITLREVPPEEDLEATSLALGFLLERGWVRGLTLAGILEVSGSGYARSLLNALELKRVGINYVSCPTCGRCRVDLEAIVDEVKRRTQDVKAPMTVAIMGCEVNGPGEARHADIGIASGTESGLLIKDGEAVAKYKESELVDVLVDEIQRRAEAMEV